MVIKSAVVPTEAPGLTDAPRPGSFSFPVDALAGLFAERAPVRADARVVTLFAPSGYGKTVFLRGLHTAAGTRGRASVWLDLQKKDREPDYLATRLLQALGHPHSHVEDSLDRLCEVLSMAAPVIIVLDSAEAVAESPSEEFLSRLLQRAANDVTFLVAGRQMLDLDLGRLRTRGVTEEINADRLRLTRVEAASLLSALPDPGLSDEQKSTILDVADGWPAGLGLIAYSLNLTPGAFSERGSRIGTWPALSEYFLALLKHERPDIEQTLQKASILNEIDGEVFDDMFGGEGGHNLLEQSHRRGLFLFSDDLNPSEFRMHPLFRDALRARYSRLDPAGKRASHHAASEYFARSGKMEEAFDHAVEAKDLLQAAHILDAFCLEDAGESVDWRIVLLARKLPVDVRSQFPRILLAMVWPLTFRWEFDQAHEALSECRAQLERIVSEGKISASALKDIENLIVHREMMLSLFRNDISAAENHSRALIDGYVQARPLVKASLFITLLQVHRDSFNLRDADALYARAKKLLDRSTHPRSIIPLEAVMAEVRLMRGASSDYVHSLAATLEECAASADGDPLIGMIGLPLAKIYYERNDIELAQSLVDRFLPLTPEAGFLEGWVSGRRVKASLLALDGKMDAALEQLGGGAAWVPAGGSNCARSFFSADKIQLLLACGRTTEALDFGKDEGLACSSSDVVPKGRVTAVDEVRAISWVRLAKAQGTLVDAMRVATQWRTFTERAGALRNAIRWDVILATLLIADEQPRAAHRHLRRAITAAAPWGYFRTVIDEGAAVSELLRSQPEIAQDDDQSVRQFGQKLMRLAEGQQGEAKSASAALSALEEQQAPAHVVLTNRETELIRMVAAGLSNREIGLRAGMTEGSVKWYLHQIYEKMGVNRRTMAARRARELGIAN